MTTFLRGILLSQNTRTPCSVARGLCVVPKVLMDQRSVRYAAQESEQCTAGSRTSTRGRPEGGIIPQAAYHPLDGAADGGQRPRSRQLQQGSQAVQEREQVGLLWSCSNTAPLFKFYLFFKRNLTPTSTLELERTLR